LIGIKFDVVIMDWQDILLLKQLLIRTSFEKAYPNLYDNVADTHPEMAEYLTQRENEILQLYSQKTNINTPLEVIIDNIVMSIIEVRSEIEFELEEGLGDQPPLSLILVGIPDKWVKLVFRKVREYLGELNKEVDEVNQFIVNRTVKELIKALLFGMYVVMQEKTSEKVSKGMNWENILKGYTEVMMIDAFAELHKAVGIWAGINNYDMGDEEDFGTLAHRLLSIKQAAVEDVELDLYKQFERVRDITEDAASVRKPLWELYKMLQWREDLQ
jgi:hypothetical protein